MVNMERYLYAPEYFFLSVLLGQGLLISLIGPCGNFHLGQRVRFLKQWGGGENGPPPSGSAIGTIQYENIFESADVLKRDIMNNRKSL